MKILITGSRTWTDKKIILKALSKQLDILYIIHGGARGADSLAGEAARELKLDVKVYPAEWNKYGKRAGYLRNKQMLDTEKPDLVLAFHKDSSRGTQHTINLARERGIPVEIFTE